MDLKYTSNMDNNISDESKGKTNLDIYNSMEATKQSIFDSYNNLLFSDDVRIFQKMAKRIEIYMMVKDLPGDICEVGVFKGAGMALWLKLFKMYEPNSISKVNGFDFFSPVLTLETLDGQNKSLMSDVIKRSDNNSLDVNTIQQKLDVVFKNRFNLIPGNVVETTKSFASDNPGLKIKVLYMDIDVGEPTYVSLTNLWSHVTIGGIIVFDEYAYHKWDESIGVDGFLEKIKGKYEQYSTYVATPTLFIKKISN